MKKMMILTIALLSSHAFAGNLKLRCMGATNARLYDGSYKDLTKKDPSNKSYATTEITFTSPYTVEHKSLNPLESGKISVSTENYDLKNKTIDPLIFEGIKSFGLGSKKTGAYVINEGKKDNLFRTVILAAPNKSGIYFGEETLKGIYNGKPTVTLPIVCQKSND